MFQGGLPKCKGMHCHLIIKYWFYLSWILLGMDWWRCLAKRVGLVCALVPFISFGCYPWILVLWDLFYLPFGSRVVLIWKPSFWVHGHTPLPAHISPFPLNIPPFIFSLTWVHILILGPHWANLPIPFPQPWEGVRPRMMPQRLKKLKKKVKRIIDHI